MKTAAILVIALVLAGTLGAVVNSYVDEKGRQIDHHVGSYVLKDTQGTLYRVTYNVQMLGGDLIFNLDQLRGVQRVQCDSTNIELLVQFWSQADAVSFFKAISNQASDRFVTGTNWNCSDVQAGSLMLMRRVFKAELDRTTVILHTAQGYYEESIKEGVITMDKAEMPEDHSKTFCFGVNSNADCTAASKPIPIYENKYLTLTCSNCFIGAKATVFIDVQISWFKVRKVATGFRDINVNAALILDLAAQANWAAGYDKTYKLVDGGVIIQFWIGPIPVSITYDIPLQILANAKVDLQAHATAGAKANWKIGDAYISWDEKDGWHIVKPTPVFTWQPVLEGDASFKAEAGLSIIPSFVLNILRVIQASVKLTPSLMFQAEGDVKEKKLCADLQYQVSSEARAEMHINIPFIRIRIDKVFGPYVLFDTGVKPIGHWCAK
jgi:hypothetical protein